MAKSTEERIHAHLQAAMKLILKSKVVGLYMPVSTAIKVLEPHIPEVPFDTVPYMAKQLKWTPSKHENSNQESTVRIGGFDEKIKVRQSSHTKLWYLDTWCLPYHLSTRQRDAIASRKGKGYRRRLDAAIAAIRAHLDALNRPQEVEGEEAGQ